jgi:predicted alpha-1,2-mannosidase
LNQRPIPRFILPNYYFYTMIKYIVIISCLFQTIVSAQDLTRYVDPMTGTGGVGHTYPGATVPFGMVQLSPDTRRDASWEGCGGYYHSDTLIYGFTHTHLSGTGCSDYGDILLMPGNGQASFIPEQYGSAYSHESERAEPGYYSVSLTDDQIKAELTTTIRAGMHRYTFSKKEERYLMLDLRHRDKTHGASLRFVSDTRLEGYRHSEAWAKDQYIYFAMEFSQPIARIVLNGLIPEMKPESAIEQNEIAAAVYIGGGNRETAMPLLVKVGISTVDAAGARRNLDAEMSDWDFEKVKLNAKNSWNKELSKIQVFGKKEKDLINFYTALYHTMIVPNVISDMDGRYRGRDNRIHNAEGYTQYTVFSLWDTFRAAHPLYTLVNRKRTLDFIKTFLAQYQQGGRLPVWELGANETDCMIGYHSVPVITDALVKGVGGFDTSLAFEAMKKSATWKHLGLPAYMERGYIGVEDEHESVSKTLEYAYDDWCISEVARMLGKSSEQSTYLRRAASYRNVYDPQTGFMRPRRNGDFIPNFDPREVNNHYTEANSWQYSFFVPQDIPGLVKLMGGDQQAEAKLDGLFSAPTNTTGRTQADITGLIGQYAHGNEPSHHMAYLYDYIGKPWKTQKLVRQIMDSLYHKGPEGLPGNEDCGQMSAWFVWSALGFYPVTPGSPYYALGSPLFDSALVHLENGKTVRLIAKNNSLTAVYVRSLSIDGVVQDVNLITHDQLTHAKEVVFEMGDTPAPNRGTVPEVRGTMSLYYFYRAPVIKAAGRVFDDSLLVTIESPDGGMVLFGPHQGLMMMGEYYREPFYIHQTTTIYAQCGDQKGKSGTTSATFYKRPNHWNVVLHTTPIKQYAAEGPLTMIDGIHGTDNWRKGDWHGYQSTNMDAEIQFGKEEKISSVTVGFLQDTRSWILMPKEMLVEISSDGKKWTTVGRKENAIPDNDLNVQTQMLAIEFKPVKAKFIRVKAVNYGTLPKWHQGAGYEAYIFCDEIEVK